MDFYCIYKQGHEPSQQPLEDAIASGNQYGINVIPYPGVYNNVNEKMQAEGLFINGPGKHRVWSKGVIGCFLSHYNLWKKCVEVNKPIGILEYDAVFINPLPDDITSQFHDYLHLDYTRHSPGIGNKTAYLEEIESTRNNPVVVCPLEETVCDDSNSIDCIDYNYINGTNGYLIKPTGASKLINSSREHGILPSDMMLNLQYVDVYYTWPSVVMLNFENMSREARISHTVLGKLTT